MSTLDTELIENEILTSEFLDMRDGWEKSLEPSGVMYSKMLIPESLRLLDMVIIRLRKAEEWFIGGDVKGWVVTIDQTMVGAPIYGKMLITTIPELLELERTWKK